MATPTLPCKAVAKYDYAATEDSELTLKKGEEVTIEQSNDSGWCLAVNDAEQSGWVPKTYVDMNYKQKHTPKPSATPKDSGSSKSRVAKSKSPKDGNEADDEDNSGRAKKKGTPQSSSKTKVVAQPTPKEKKGKPDALPPPPSEEPSRKPRPSSKKVVAKKKYDTLPPPPPPAPEEDEMPPPPPAPQGGDDSDSTPLEDSEEEEKPKVTLIKRKKLQDVMKKEREIVANEIFAQYADNDEEIGVTADGDFDSNKWMDEMLSGGDADGEGPPPDDSDDDEAPPPPTPRGVTKPIQKPKKTKSPMTPEKKAEAAERKRAATTLDQALSSDRKKKVDKGQTTLDLSYVTDHLICIAFPSEAVGAKNTLKEYRKFFMKYHENHTKVYNLSAEKGYKVESMKPIPTVTSFQFEVASAPSFTLVLDVCKSISEWETSNPANMTVIHCVEGARTGLIVCCYLIFTGVCNSASQALRYYAAFRGKKSMIFATPSQIRYLNYFENYMTVLKKNQSVGAIDKLMGQTDSDGPERAASPTPRTKPLQVEPRASTMVAKSTPALLKKIILDFVSPVQYVVVKVIELVRVPKSYLSPSVAIWFRITHADFVYESKSKVHPIRNQLNNKIQMPVPDKTSKDGCPLLNNDIKLELFVARKCICVAWFNTRFLEPANLNEDLEEAQDIVKTLETKSIGKWDSNDKIIYQDAMDIIRKHKERPPQAEEITQMEGKGSTGTAEDAYLQKVLGGDNPGQIYDVYKLTLDKRKLDKLCLDHQNKETPGDFVVTIVFHKPKVQSKIGSPLSTRSQSQSNEE